jgi:LmbE family N-acetylglucosaminyl deacetylase
VSESDSPLGAKRIVPVGDLPHSAEGVSIDLAVPKVALAIAAHPDDIEFGCGATLAKWASAGCRIHHLVLTDGSKGTWDESADTDELIRLRQVEQREAARILGGGDVTFLGVTDGELDSGMELRKSVCEVIRRVRPNVILGHDPWRRYRLHPDHRHAGWLTTDGLVATRDHAFFPETGRAHRPDHLLLWEADVPNHVESAQGHIETKIAALLAHRSQHLSTMGIGGNETDQNAEESSAERSPNVRGEYANAEGATENAKREENDEALIQTALFVERVREQLARHGAIADLSAGEAFHRIDET